MTGASVFHKNDGSIDYVDLANELASMVHGYPYSEPPEMLRWIAHELRADPGSRHGRAMMIAAWASRWYTKWRITDVMLFDNLIEAAARAGEVFDAAGCTAPGEHEHPEIDADDPDGAASVVALIGDPAAWYASDPLSSADVEDIEALSCPGFLGLLAAETAEDLRDARKERFRAPATDHMNERYLTKEGRTDLDVLISDIERQEYSRIDPTAERAAVWAARRLLGDARPEERAPLALAVCHLAGAGWSPAAPGVVAVYREALQRFDLAPLDQPCPHPEGHPHIKAQDTPRHARAHISPLAEADEHGERCPHRVAERVREVTAHTTEYLGIEADPL